MSDLERKLKHGIHTPEQAVTRFKRLRRIARVRERAGQSYDDLLLEMISLDEFLATRTLTWRPNFGLPRGDIEQNTYVPSFQEDK